MKPGTTCADHTDGPSGYAAWHEWADEMAKTHDMWRCTECGFWSIWAPKKASR
jgi:hypothetical protein